MRERRNGYFARGTRFVQERVHVLKERVQPESKIEIGNRDENKQGDDWSPAQTCVPLRF